MINDDMMLSEITLFQNKAKTRFFVVKKFDKCIIMTINHVGNNKY